jgi:transcriptional regulator with XRE-family HTH domain
MNLIATFRKELGLTQKQFSEKVKVSISVISKAERGTINIGNACAICNAFPNDFIIKDLSIQRINK